MSRRDGTTWLSPALLLLGLPGCLSIRGPKSVRGVERGSLTVQCRYDPGWEAHDKWWCRGELWSICHILVQTTRSGRGTDGERVSISDDRSDRLITVTMTGLRRDDQDVYWCGISKRGTDLGVPIKVSVDPESLLSRTTVSHRNMSSGSHIR
uniref:CD300 molecule like family member b n=1 Tax=Rousettus aegyptiacus TaxID=9407 RepID=A0A7J8G5I8_ROUAE|nr:CD300 molecule like family member b [Rousettus aegyptiacus]